jgi:hypothetical protein
VCNCIVEEHLWPYDHFSAHLSQRLFAHRYCLRALSLSSVVLARAASVDLLSSAKEAVDDLSSLGGGGR